MHRLYGRNARNNVISDCYVYRTEFENNSGNNWKICGTKEWRINNNELCCKW